MYQIPTSTYRLQFHKDFTLKKAIEIIDYIQELGISTVYSSPLLKARPGSTHGYDCVDHNELNPEIGTNDDFDAFTARLHQRDLDLLLDIVPNHMGVNDVNNKWWVDVLEHGESSMYAHYFDINWHPRWQHLAGKVILPVLGAPLSQCIEKNELQLILNEENHLKLKYYGLVLPISLCTIEPLFREIASQCLSRNMDCSEILKIEEELKRIMSHDDPRVEDKEKRRHRMELVNDAKSRLQHLMRSNHSAKEVLESSLNSFCQQKEKFWAFIRQQPYYLCFWKAATDEINYRRFFDINELMSLRIEDEEVYSDSHKMIFEWIKQGKVAGLRLDHPDGLKDPQQYFTRLQNSISTLLQDTTGSDKGKSFYVLVEKILEKGEELPNDWAVDGTTGYDFMNMLNGVFVATKHYDVMKQIYQKFIQTQKTDAITLDFPQLLYSCKKLILTMSLESELTTLTDALYNICKKSMQFSELTFRQCKLALEEYIAFFPVYRTYLSPSHELPNDTELHQIESSIALARQKNPALDPILFDMLESILLHKVYIDRDERLFFVARLQQLLGPLMAKGLEDTAFYRYFILCSLNEVGGDPNHFGLSLNDFHKEMILRAKTFPLAMSSTSTHDTKRSEDVRARINVLSEIPLSWNSFVTRLAELTKDFKKYVPGIGMCPQPNDEYMLYQTLIGTWPFEISTAEWNEYIKRIQAYMTKAIKESKVYTTWTVPNQAYEQSVLSFVERILSDGSFLSLFNEYQKYISQIGKLNSLSQLVLKMSLPGVPDTYQGTELWDFSLVDPDNRRPVDYSLRSKMLHSIKPHLNDPNIIEELWKSSNDGRIKMYTLYKMLALRNKHSEVLLRGQYIPVEVTGPKHHHLIAYIREHNGSRILVVASRFFTHLYEEHLSSKYWIDTFLHLPTTVMSNQRLHDVLANRTIDIAQEQVNFDQLEVPKVLDRFPIAVFEFEPIHA
jgi:(1->4)-alpha-D-glucan 1-alpha-D-glucosylmutase